MLSHGGVGPLKTELLRIEYDEPDADYGFDIAGFVLRNARAWAEAIRQRKDAPVTVYAGRKKK